jgi:hypothetical protein
MRMCHSNLPKGHLFNVKPVALKLKVPHRTTDENPQDSHFCSKWQACRLTAFTTPPVGYGVDLVAVCPKNVTREHVPTEPESLHIFRRVALPQAIGLSVPLRVRCVALSLWLILLLLLPQPYTSPRVTCLRDRFSNTAIIHNDMKHFRSLHVL